MTRGGAGAFTNAQAPSQFTNFANGGKTAGSVFENTPTTPRAVRSLARRFSCKEFTEQDLVQEGMLAYMRAEKTFDPMGKAKFETYASAVIRNRFIDLMRRAPAGTSQINDDTVGGGTNFDDEIKLIEIKKVLKENVGEVERAIFTSYIEGFTYEEISKIFDLPRKKIDNTVQKVKKIIKDRV